MFNVLYVPITTKLAAFFRFDFLYSATTSKFLLLMRGVSCIDTLATELLTSATDLSFAFGVCEGLTGQC